jgi:beta-glucosidase
MKHFAANNQEYCRMSIDTIVDERTMRELYLSGFEKAVKDAQPWTVMNAYNKINGEFCSDNKYLLTDILKEEWGHKGLVVTDWGATNDRVAGLKAGLELEMPGSRGINDKKIVEAVTNGTLEESILNDRVKRLLTLIFQSEEILKDTYTYDKEAHHQLAKKVASESIVLLKNEDNLLPLEMNGIRRI